MKVDNEGIPVLEERVPADAAGAGQPVPGMDLTDHEQISQLLEIPAIRQILDDITEDVQKLVTWKIESLLKEEVNKLIHEATESSAPKLTQDIRTQLQLALPELLTSIAEQARTR